MFDYLDNDVATKDVALTLQKIAPLFDVVNEQITKLGAIEKPLNSLAGKSWIKYQCRIYKKLAKTSVKKIMRKIPINVELPKFVSVGNGQVKKVFDNQEQSDVNQIDVYSNLPEIEG